MKNSGFRVLVWSTASQETPFASYDFPHQTFRATHDGSNQHRTTGPFWGRGYPIASGQKRVKQTNKRDSQIDEAESIRF